MAGNQRFVAGTSTHPHQGLSTLAELAEGQRPFATVLGCSDSRVPAELVFDQGLGDLFVVRTAGHVIGQAAMGSLEFSVAVLEVPLIVVMSHTRCGAIAATVSTMETGDLPSGHLRDLVERIAPSMLAARAGGASRAEEVGLTHLIDTVARIGERSARIRQGMAAGTIGIVGARYDLATGLVTQMTALETG